MAGANLQTIKRDSIMNPQIYNKEARALADHLYNLKVVKNSTEKEYSETRQKILAYFDKFVASGSKIQGKIAQITKSEVTTVTYFIDKLKKTLDPDILSEVIERTYSVDDMNGLIKLMKRYKVDPKEFKKLITITESVNKKVLDELFEVGELTMEDLEDCYEVSISARINVEPLPEPEEDDWDK